MSQKLVLLGGGHAHLRVLKSLTERYLPGGEVTLVSPYGRQIYSGMLPGWVAGHYTLEQCAVPLAPLAQRGDVTFIEKSAARIDFAERAVICGDGTAIAFDVLSIDTGPVADLTAIPGAVEHAISIRPLEKFIAAFERIRTAVESGAARRIVFVGAGAGGVEMALAMQHAFARFGAGITLISAANTLPGRTGARLANVLRERGVSLLSGQTAVRIAPNEVHLQSGSVVAGDHIIVATGTAAAAWPRESGLACDEQGFILVNDRLQSISHPHVFAAGDCMAMQNVIRPRSGVYAVRAGPPLAENLRRYFQGKPLVPYTPQTRSLYLVSTGRRHAVASWGGLTWSGGWVWAWKDWIDRRFVNNYV